MAMRVIMVQQGTPAWHEHRAKTFNASDAPAMMGCSKYKTRAELLREMATGEVKDVDEATQRRFADGHLFEALARQYAEKRIGDDLFPITAANDAWGLARALGASFDGITMSEDPAFEHKSLNDEIRGVTSVTNLPLMYLVQMEQQLMVCDNLQRIMFMASKWEQSDEPTEYFIIKEFDGRKITKYYKMLEFREFWYESNPSLRVQIIEGWKRFSEDLEAAKTIGIQEDAPKGVAAALNTLPTLSITLRGEITTSNLPAFQSAAKTFLAAIKTDLATDDDFATAKAQVTYLKEVEERIEGSLNNALAQAASIDEMRRAVLDTKAQIAEMRLKLDRTVKTRETEIKAEIQKAAMEKFKARVEQLKPLFREINPVIPSPDFAAAIKNKRTIASLNNAVEGELNRALGVASDIAAKVNNNLQSFAMEAAGFETLFPDLSTLAYKAQDDLVALIRTRIADHKAHEEAKEKAAEAKKAQEFIPAEEVVEGPIARAVNAGPPRAGISHVGSGYRAPINPAHGNPTVAQPSRMEIVNLVAERWGVSISVARDWLRAEFGGEQ